MRAPARNKSSKLRNLFERSVGDKFKSAMVKGGNNKKGGGGEMAASNKQQLFGSGSSSWAPVLFKRTQRSCVLSRSL